MCYKEYFYKEQKLLRGRGFELQLSQRHKRADQCGWCPHASCCAVAFLPIRRLCGKCWYHVGMSKTKFGTKKEAASSRT